MMPRSFPEYIYKELCSAPVVQLGFENRRAQGRARNVRHLLTRANFLTV